MPPMRSGRPTGLGELAGTLDADRQVLGVGGGRVDRELAGAQRGRTGTGRHPEDHRLARLTGRHGGEPDSVLPSSNSPAVDGGDRGDPRDRAVATGATELLKPPEPCGELVMMWSALTASSTLLVADFDRDAPNTAIVDTRARPTIRADAVWAVRRGLRIEFSRPSLPGVAEQPGQGPTEDARQRAGHEPGPAWPTR